MVVWPDTCNGLVGNWPIPSQRRLVDSVPLDLHARQSAIGHRAKHGQREGIDLGVDLIDAIAGRRAVDADLSFFAVVGHFGGKFYFRRQAALR